DNVGCTTWRKRHDQAHRPRRIGLRESDPRDDRQRGRAGCQIQELATGKFHFEPPLLHSITLSARSRSESWIVSPIALAVVRLMTRSNLVGCSTGISPGFVPRRILSANSASRRNKSKKSGP